MPVNTIPKISVLFTVYNEKPEFLLSSIESILSQTEESFELLLLDDASDNQECLAAIRTCLAKDPRIRLIRNARNSGLTKTLNIGLHESRGEYIARQDADDISDPERFKKQLGFLESHPEYALCGTWAAVIDGMGNIVGHRCGPITPKEARKQILSTNTFVHSSFFFRKSNILLVGGYSEYAQKAQDYDLLLKLIPKFSVANIPEYLCLYRIHPENISFSNNKNQEYYAIAIRLRALKEYGYSKKEYGKIIIPLLFYHCVPSCMKKFLIRLLWKI